MENQVPQDRVDDLARRLMKRQPDLLNTLSKGQVSQGFYPETNVNLHGLQLNEDTGKEPLQPAAD